MDEKRVGNIGGLGCMGNEGVQWIGMSDFLERDHFIQNIGDGTFFHSGQLAVQASVAAGVNVTYKLLYNGTVAMTGGQHPQAQLGVPEVAANLLRQGVSQVLITTEDVDRFDRASLPNGVEVWYRDRLIEAQERLAKVRGTTVLIHVQACAAEERRARTRGLAPTPGQRVIINHRICEGCGDCGRVSNCLSVQPVETAFGRKTEIDQTSCNLDYSCLEGDCPSFITITRRSSVPDSKPTPQRATPMPVEELPLPVRIVPEDEFAMRITGIGGTGVVTVAQIVGTAAMLDGFQVRGLDQIGLSQKAGPVVSDLRFSMTSPTSTNRLGAGQADLLLAFDQLVATSEKGLLTADPLRTTVVGSTTATPTGEMIAHLEVELPAVFDLSKRIADATRSQAQFWADAAEITKDLFGSAKTANIFVVGMAVQAGCLPIAGDRLEEAIRLNGVSIDDNVAAFRWGRLQIANPDAVNRVRRDERDVLLDAAAQKRFPVGESIAVRIAAFDNIAAPGSGDVDTVALTRYASELVAWGGPQRAVDWLDVLDRIRITEKNVNPNSHRLTSAVAANLYKLMAYKDEYEVARLMSDEDAMAEAHEIAGAHGRIAWKLHPPLLRAFGLRRKIAFGLWTAPLFRLLAKARFLRGTIVDPFGYAKLRRLERELPDEYIAVLDRILAGLSPANLDAAVTLAELPDQIRGYEDLKLERIAHYREALAVAETAFGAGR
jgi:indolepyruvate ferredoxin oxidoreductase